MRPEKPQTWQLEESLTKLMESREAPVLSYRVPRTPTGWWHVQLRSRVLPLSLPAREVAALVTGLWEGINSCTPTTALARTRGQVNQEELSRLMGARPQGVPQ